jgi:adenosine deaminase
MLDWRHIPKVELHVHLDGALTFEAARGCARS